MNPFANNIPPAGWHDDKQYKKPPLWKTVPAIAIGIVGALFMVASLTFIGDRSVFPGMFIFGFAIALPGIWFFLHERRARRQPNAEPLKRHWGYIAVAMLVLTVFAVAISPDAEEDVDTQEVTESSPQNN